MDAKPEPQPAGRITLRVDYGQVLTQRCVAAGLTQRQTQVVAYTCAGLSPAAIASALSVGEECIHQTLTAAVRKLAPERPRLTHEDRRAILDAVLGRRDTHDDPMEGFHGDWHSPTRFQGVRPHGTVLSDLRSRPGPAGQLLGVVCGLTGDSLPPLRLRQDEVQRQKSELTASGSYVAVPA